MTRSRWIPALAALAVLAGCPRPDTCSASLEKLDVWSLAQDWYLYHDLLPATVDPALYATASDLLDALTDEARLQGKDRYWSFLTTRQATQQYYGSGQSVGFGIGLLVRGTAPALQLLVSQVIPGAAAADAGFLRGDEILAIGPDAAHLEPVLSHLQDGTLGTLLPPPVAGEVRAFQVTPRGGGSAVVRTATTRVYDLVPVPSHWISNGVGYVGLRTFISTAEAPLRSAFQEFKSAGVTGVVVDLRYNGGGMVSIAEVLANLLGGGLAPQPMYTLQLNANHAAEDATFLFTTQPEAIASTKVAFITTGASASASELVVNVLDPYLSAALVGAKTYGKPVGQFTLDLAPCADVLFLIAFRLVNAVGHGDYYAGLPDGTTGPTGFRAPLCPAADDLTQPQDSALEASTAAALYWLQNGTCPPAQAAPAALLARSAGVAYPAAAAPSLAQRDIPGLF
jgi:carboxyl-terminal processing protease